MLSDSYKELTELEPKAREKLSAYGEGTHYAFSVGHPYSTIAIGEEFGFDRKWLICYAYLIARDGDGKSCVQVT